MPQLMESSTLLMGDNTIPGVKIPKEILAKIPEILQACRDFGLDFWDTIVEFLTYDDISEVAAFDGFPVRYPHWRFGEQYEELSKGYQHGYHRIYEMVVNCCERGTHLMSDTGRKAIEDVRPGDFVYARDGKRRVVAVTKQDASQVVRICLREFGTPPSCTPNHRWLVLKGKKTEWVQAKDLKVGDLVCAGGRYENFLGRAAMIRWDADSVVQKTAANVRWKLKEINPSSSMTLELAELLGVCTGDGSVGQPSAENQIEVPIDKKQSEFLNRVCGLFYKVFGTTAAVYEKPTVSQVVMNSKYAVHFLDAAGFKMGSTFANKRVPEAIWQSSNEYRAAYLRGYFDSDGYIAPMLGANSKSELLLKDVQLLLLEMGIRSRLHHIRNDHNDCYEIVIKGRSNVALFYKYIGFSLAYKQERLERVVQSSYSSGGGFRLPAIRDAIVENINKLPDQNRLPSWIRSFRQRNTVGSNAMWMFVNRLIASGYEGFEEFAELLATPFYEVLAVDDAGIKETWDVALDHGSHDFLANGLVSHNTCPCYIYCLDSNTVVDHVTVIAHATGHNDFFKNNVFFSQTSQNMMNELANHGSRIRRYMSEWGKERVGRFIDKVLCIDTLIDPAAAWSKRMIRDPIIRQKREYHHPRRLRVDHDYMEEWINTPEWKRTEGERIHREDIKRQIGIFESPTKDIFGFIKDNAPLNPWQQDVIAMLYEEGIYFAPQRQTKTINEGWACARPNSLVATDLGLMRLGDVVDQRIPVQTPAGKVTNWFKFENRDCLKVKTRRGFEIEGSVTHRLLTPNDVWKRLDELKAGDKVQLARGTNSWGSGYVEVGWQSLRRTEIAHVAKDLGMTYDQVCRYRYQGGSGNAALDTKLSNMDEELKSMTYMQNRRKPIRVPGVVDEAFGEFLGYMIGDGNISDVKRVMGLTTGNAESRDRFVALARDLFGLECRVKWDDTSKNGRWRVLIHSRDLRDLLVSLGLPTGPSARVKTVPDCILRSPKSVVSAFLRAYFDCDGCAHPAGVTLSTASEDMSKKVQIVLLNYGILTRRRLNEDECWHVTVTGQSAKVFADEINFGIAYKRERLQQYVDDRKWFVKEEDVDEVVSVEDIGKHDVYDITVEGTHRYAAQGFVNHNSYVDSQIMARFGFAEGSGIFDYASHKAGVLGGKLSMNPYKLGYLLFLWIEECYNKGRFGREYEECEDSRLRETWDKKLGLGHEKVFEVRQFYDDVLMIAEFFDQEFCDKYEFFVWERFPNGEYKIVDRDAARIKQLLVKSKLNGGLPEIKLVDPNHKGKRVFMMEHTWDGRILHPQMTKDTIRALGELWHGPVAVLSKDKDGQEIVYYCEDDQAVITTAGKL